MLLARTPARHAEAEALLTESLQGRLRFLGESHPETLRTMTDLGNLLERAGRPLEAERLYLEALQGRRQSLGVHHAHTIATLGACTRLLNDLGRFADAMALLIEYEQAIRPSREEHPSAWRDVVRLGITCADAWHADAPDAGHDATAAAWRMKLETPSDSGE